MLISRFFFDFVEVALKKKFNSAKTKSILHFKYIHFVFDFYTKLQKKDVLMTFYSKEDLIKVNLFFHKCTLLYITIKHIL